MADVAVLTDPGREPHPEPCGDCGRVHLRGEHVGWWLPAPEGGQRLVWEGCADCWLRRAAPIAREGEVRG